MSLDNDAPAPSPAMPPADTPASPEGAPPDAEGSAEPPAPEHPPFPPAAPRAPWLREASRALLFRAPRWPLLEGHPGVALLAVAALYLVVMGLQRALIDGPAQFYGTAILNGWIGMSIAVWLCWVVARSGQGRKPEAPTTGTLVTLMLVMDFLYGVAGSLLWLAGRAIMGPVNGWPSSLQWVLGLVPIVWLGSAFLCLLWRLSGSGLMRAAVVVLAPLPLVLSTFQSAIFWWPKIPPPEPATYSGLPLNEAVLEAQPQLLAAALKALQPSEPGRINVYAVTYAPYASQDVFMHESALVAKTMGERFGAAGRTVELVLNPATATRLPWATATYLRQTIHRMAAVMDRDKDVLFIHLTSHGGKNAVLATDSEPLETDAITPWDLKRWLDDAGIRWRVISISACYSGSWIEPLADEGTLVMTAADADHTSYGCGSRSPLTFFGRAMYEDALTHTWSFEKAHAEARQLIDQREREAGKSDGYSNPQIRMGSDIRGQLARLEAQQAAR